MFKKSANSIWILVVLSAILIVLPSCQTQKTAGQEMMDVSGESFPIRKIGLFGKDHDFWIYKIRDVVRSATFEKSVSLKRNKRVSTEKAFGLILFDSQGYEWDVFAHAVLIQAQRRGQSNREKTISSYSISATMEDVDTGTTRNLNAVYKPGDPGFDGTLRGSVTKDNNQLLYEFESNARLDTYRRPDEGLSVISFYKENTTIAVLDSRHGFEVTFYEGLQPAERTQLAASISTLFVLMKYGQL